LLEREGLVYRVPAVGAFVNPKTQEGAGARQQTTIGLITLDIGGAMEMTIARGVERASQQRGWSLQIYDSHGDIKTEERNLNRLNEGTAGVNGVIILPTGSHDNIEHLFRLKLGGLPIVLIDRGIAGLKVDLVESDHESGAHLATSYLIRKGHRRVVLLSEPAGATSIADRIRGYERAMREHGLPVVSDWHIWVDPEVSSRGVREDHRWLGGYEAACQGLGRLKTPVAIFALNDYIAWGLVKACQKLGLRVPEDVSVVCFDDSDITRAMSPPLTVVAQRPREIGEKALEVLAQRLEESGAARPPQHILLGVDLMERGSVAELPAGAVA
jgi:DNA-binding LacI/PurR family transcriptional regulator